MRRVAFYFFHDPQGQVDDHVLHTLEHLRPHVDHLLVASACPLDDTARRRLDRVADTVWEHDGGGSEVGSRRAVLEHVGAELLAAHDEVLLIDSTLFGPVGTFDALFAEMDSRPELDFWAISERRPRAVGAPAPADLGEPYLETPWLAVRARLATSEDWRRYWSGLDAGDGGVDAASREARFTPHFAGLGYRHAAAFPITAETSGHPLLDDTAQLLRAGCPVVLRRVFVQDPLHNEARAVDGRQVVDLMAAAGYPVEALYSHLARTSVPRALMTNLALLDVLPHTDLGYDHARPLRVVAVAHVFYPEMTDDILDRLDHLPSGYDLVVTTADEQRRAAILEVLARRGRDGEVRVVASNRGRDISAFLIDCRDVIEGDDHDLVVKVHSKLSPQDVPTIAEMFRRHLFDNLLASPGYAANVLRLFQQHSSLGMVIPPIYHLGYPTLGISWFQNKPAALALAARLGITVPFDATTPVAPYGSMFIARPQALRTLAAGDFHHDDFPDEGGYRDGALTHVVERLFAYAALSSGFHVREVLDPHLAAVNYKALEFRGVVLGEVLGPYPRRALKRVERLKQVKAGAERAAEPGGSLRGGLRRAGAALRRTPTRGVRRR